MQMLLDWLDQRVEYRRMTSRMRQRVLPHGPSWWFTSATCLFWLLVIECVTGLMLMATYSPSMTSAWASVHFIDQNSAGRFLRGVHHYSSHVLIIVFAVHVVRVLMTGAYRAPRELIWITGLLLFPLVIVWTVTGNPLSASQKGISQIQVEGNILAGTPFIGQTLQKLMFGGDDVGNLTLTRLYFLHVGLMPILVGGLCFIHLHQVLKHSSYRLGDAVEGPQLSYWPYQSVRNMITLAVVMAGISLISLIWGAPLHAPADPDLPHSPRPEWYFRWLFELRRYFSGDTEFIATLVVPGLFMFAFLAVPFLDRSVSSKFSSVCRGLTIAACFVGWGGLTLLSYANDWRDTAYQKSVVEFDAMSARALELASREAITTAGASQLLRNDPLTQGPLLFARHCASCHSHADAAGQGIVAAVPSAPNLLGIGRSEWIMGFLDAERISSDDYLGKTAFGDGDMAQHVRQLRDNAGEGGQKELQKKLTAVAYALAGESGHERPDTELATRGRELLTGEMGCVDCHKFHDQGDLGSAPDLTGYASIEWLSALIAAPNTSRFYGERNDRMPSFAADASHPELNLMTPTELKLLVGWLSQAHLKVDEEIKNVSADKPKGAPLDSPPESSGTVGLVTEPGK